MFNLLENLKELNKAQELRGNPFEAIRENTIRVDKNDFIIPFEIKKEDFDLENFYRTLDNYSPLKNYVLQFFYTDEKLLLVVKFKDFKNSQKVKQIMDDLNVKRLSVDEYSKQLLYFLEHKEISTTGPIPEYFNKYSSKIEYKKDHIVSNDTFYRILKIEEYTDDLQLDKIKELACLDIKVTFPKEEKKVTFYNSLRQELETENERQMINPLGNEKKLTQLEKAEDYSMLGLEINLLVKASSKNKLDQKTKKLQQLTNDNGYNTRVLYFIDQKDLTNVITLTTHLKFVSAFYNDEKIFFFGKNQAAQDKRSFFSRLTNGFFDNFLDFDKDIIPLKNIYENGLMKLPNDYYARVYRFENVNYIFEQEQDKNKILNKYEEFINIISDTIRSQLFIQNSDLNKQDLSKDLLLKKKDQDDSYSTYVDEYNQHLKNKIDQVYESASQTSYYIVISTKGKNALGVTDRLKQVYDIMKDTFDSLGSELTKLTANETLKLIYDSINQPDNQNKYIDTDFQISLANKLSPLRFKKGHKTIDFGNKIQKTFFIEDYPSEMRDNFLSDITKLPFSTNVSLHIHNFDSQKSIRKVKNKLVDMEAQKEETTSKDSDYVPLQLQKKLKEAYYTLNKLQDENQNLYTVSFYITIFADNKEDLENNESKLNNIFSKHLFKGEDLELRQAEGFLSTLPFGIDKVKQNRALLTENVQFLTPFTYKNIYHNDGIFYGVANSEQILSVNRKKYQNPSAFFLGVPGSGKSFMAKLEMFNVFFKTNDDILIIDPEREYGDLAKKLGGEVIKLTTKEDNHLNIMATPDFSEGMIKDKIEFMITFLEKLSQKELDSKDKSILDRCMRNIYEDFKEKKQQPKLSDLYNMLLNQKEQRAKDLALTMEIFVEGSLDIFAKESNVDTKKRVVCYDIKDLRRQLKPPALAAVLDSITERLNKNRGHKNTWIYIDEMYLLFEGTSSKWLFETWKRIRKYWGVPTGITQNITDLLQDYHGRTMLSNSEFAVIMNQAENDRKKLVEFLGVSETQKQNITNTKAGVGLFSIEGNNIPFENRVDKDSLKNLFQLIQTGQEEI